MVTRSQNKGHNSHDMLIYNQDVISEANEVGFITDDDDDSDSDYIPEKERSSVEIKKITQQNRQKLSNYSMECCRYNISNSAAASIGTTLLQDVDILRPNNSSLVIDV